MSLLALFCAQAATSVLLFDWNELGAAGQTWPGWAWSADADGYGNPGWRRTDAVDVGGDDWRPRSHQKEDCGVGVTAHVDSSVRAPSTASGASLRLTKSSPWLCWWGVIADNVFRRKGWAQADTNRFSWYARYEGLPDMGLRSSDPQDWSEQIGTYVFPDDRVTAGNEVNHYYHFVTAVSDVWIHVMLDRHPQHERGVSAVPGDDPDAPQYPYYGNMPSFYWDWNASRVWVDEVRLWTQSQPENDISISSVWVGYRPTDDRWLLSFQDSSWGGSYGNSSVGTYEVRWATTPISNETWGSATAVTPLYNVATGAGSGPGRVRRPNPWKQVAYTEFEIPDAIEASSDMIYIAIKDVSSTSYGDGHASPSPNVKTIDYALRAADRSAPSPPTNLRVVGP